MFVEYVEILFVVPVAKSKLTTNSLMDSEIFVDRRSSCFILGVLIAEPGFSITHVSSLISFTLSVQ